MCKKTYGYARVSTKEQNLDRQIEALKEYGINERDIITDKASGKNFNREGYITLKNSLLRKGDTLVIKELDRLGRDMEQIKQEWQELQAKEVNIIVLDTPILNTEGKTDLEKKLISNIVFELLSYMAEKERAKIRQRQKEGIQALRDKNNGKAKGRPKIEAPTNFKEEYKNWKSGKQTATETFKKLGLSKAKFYRLVKELEEV